MEAVYAKRRQRLRKLLRTSGADSFLITNELNVTYLTGFSGDSSYLWMDQSREILLSDSRYSIQISEECPELEIVLRDARSTIDQLAIKTVAKTSSQNLALEATHLSKARFDQLETGLKNVTAVPTSGLVERLRAIKDKTELATIRQSIRIAERAFEVIRAQLSQEQTELQIAHNLEHQIRAFDGTRCAFDPIVGVGERGALPHGQPSAKQIGESGFCLIDWGAQFRGYASDLTRILVTGKISPKLRKIYDLVLKAQRSAIDKIRDGAKLSDVDLAARKVIDDGGFGKKFGHGLGHGFGLQIHEPPFITPVAESELKAGMVITIEPGIYLPNWGGVRIEDDVLVTKAGCEVLSTLPKQLDECVVNLH